MDPTLVEVFQSAMAGTTEASGATLFGLALALWYTHEPGKPWGHGQVAFLGMGLGAATSYLVGWLEPIKVAFTVWLS